MNKKELELIRSDSGRSVLFKYSGQSRHGDSTTACSSGESSSQQHLRYSDQHEQLTNVLTRTLAGKSDWHYYQGLHDIAGVLLYNIQKTHGTSDILSRLCQVHLRDALREDLNALTSFINAVFFPLMNVMDEELHDLFHESNLEASTAILPWIITWFTHDIHDAQVASRLVDAFLSAHPLFPLWAQHTMVYSHVYRKHFSFICSHLLRCRYVSVALLIHPRNRVDILNADLDAASIHVAIRSLTFKVCGDWTLPNEDCITVQDLIDDAITIMCVLSWWWTWFLIAVIFIFLPFHGTCIRRRHSPRSLLQLARMYSDGGDCPLSLNMTHSVAFLRAPPSWSMAASTTMRHHHDKENIDKTAKEFTTILEDDVELPTPRAKCASGVFFLMSSEDQEAVLSKRLEISSSLSGSPKSVTTKWELCQQILFGNCSTEEPCSFSTFCEWAWT